MEEKKKKPQFQRTKFRAYKKLGKGQKSRQKYRKAKGRHNKTRQAWKGRPVKVQIGFKNKTDIRGLISGRKPILINNIKELKNVKKENVIIIGKIGMKKKIEIAKEAQRQKIEIVNLNINKFLRQSERIISHRKKSKKPEEKKQEKKEDKPKEEKKE